jgi:hypothetical protein
MTIRTLLRYLFLFDRQAILEIASDRSALVTGRDDLSRSVGRLVCR